MADVKLPIQCIASLNVELGRDAHNWLLRVNFHSDCFFRDFTLKAEKEHC